MWITPEPRYFDSFVHFVETLNTDKIIHLGLDVKPDFQGIVYNTEQVSIPRILAKILKLAHPSEPLTPLAPLVATIESWNPLTTKLEFWDYSLANIKILEKHGIKAKYVPLKTTGPYLEKLQIFAKYAKIYDIGFNGTISGRRKKILDQLATTFTVLTSTNWGDKRDAELGQCRVLINIHYDTDYMIFESARCEPWLAAGVPVISELSIDNDDRCILTTYDGFFDTVKAYFANKNMCLN
jgi:hypothetical protein